MYRRSIEKPEPSSTLPSPASRSLKKQVRITKKIRTAKGWQFISLPRVNNRYVWDKREGYYYIEWWEGRRRCRQIAGQTPTQATETQRRKRNELIGEMATGGRQRLPVAHEHSGGAVLLDHGIRQIIDAGREGLVQPPQNLRAVFLC